jgi:NADPH2:quinone reductase
VATDWWSEIDEDVPVSSAASGVVNPLTVLGMVDTFRKGGYHGIVHTAAASALGRMLNKICQSEKIPLLNVVRR